MIFYQNNAQLLLVAKFLVQVLYLVGLKAIIPLKACWAQSLRPTREKQKRTLTLERLPSRWCGLGAVLKPHSRDTQDKPTLRHTLPIYNLYCTYIFKVRAFKVSSNNILGR